MKKHSLSLIAVACSFALAACSNSHGGDAIDSSQYLTEKPSKPATSQSNNTANTQTNNNSTSSKPTETATQTEKTPSKETSTPAENVAKPQTEKSSETVKSEDSASSKPVETNPSTETKPQTENTPTVAENKNAFSDPIFVSSENGPLVGAIVTVKADGANQGNNPLNDGKEKLDELVVNGTKLHLFTATDLINGNGMDGFKTLSNKDVSKETPTNSNITGYAGGWQADNYNPEYFRNMRFGVVNIANQSHLFVQGYATPTNGVQNTLVGEHYPMPKSGKFLYQKGYALYGKESNYQQLAAEVEADFSAKKIQVALKEGDTQKLAFDGKIDGNTFSGKANGVETKGAFYGSLAAEVGGVFYQTEGANKGKNGVFGATDKRHIQ